MTAADQNDSTVQTTHGRVRGAALGGVEVFKGMRYGVPPTGDHAYAQSKLTNLPNSDTSAPASAE